MDQYSRANQELWNTWTPYHVTSAFYDVEAVLPLMFPLTAARDR